MAAPPPGFTGEIHFPRYLKHELLTAAGGPWAEVHEGITSPQLSIYFPDPEGKTEAARGGRSASSPFSWWMFVHAAHSKKTGRLMGRACGRETPSMRVQLQARLEEYPRGMLLPRSDGAEEIVLASDYGVAIGRMLVQPGSGLSIVDATGQARIVITLMPCVKERAPQAARHVFEQAFEPGEPAAIHVALFDGGAPRGTTREFLTP